MTDEGKWIKFILAPKQNPKTAIWFVAAKDGGGMLGEIRWFGRWRRYAFYPQAATVFEPTCLRNIAQFIDNEMKLRRVPKLRRIP